MFTRKVLISLVFVIALAFILGGCSNLFGPDDSSDGDGVEETYDVRFEVTSDNLSKADIVWTMGDDSAEKPSQPLTWHKEATCGEDEYLAIVAGKEDENLPADSNITATIYIDGEEAATATGYREDDMVAVGVETRTPDPD